MIYRLHEELLIKRGAFARVTHLGGICLVMVKMVEMGSA